MTDQKTQEQHDETAAAPPAVAPATEAAPPGSVIDPSSLDNLPAANVPASWLPTPESFEQAMEFAKVIAKAHAVPQAYRDSPGDILIAVQMGADVGLSWAQSLQNTAVINGRATLWGDAVLAVIMNSGQLEWIEETWEGEQAEKISENTRVARCIAKRRGVARPIEYTFSMAQAHAANLWPKKDTWRLYPDRMLRMRPRAWCLRDLFPDVLKGFQVREEVDDIIEGEVVGNGTTDGSAPRSSIGQRMQSTPAAEPVDVGDLEAKIELMANNAERQEVAAALNGIKDPKEKRRLGALFSARCRELDAGDGE